MPREATMGSWPVTAASNARQRNALLRQGKATRGFPLAVAAAMPSSALDRCHSLRARRHYGLPLSHQRELPIHRLHRVVRDLHLWHF
uniref:Uncharacterized protein n=1 Tax=Oryza nivara TaxID=4536 RepID=A0A0E0IGA8_ORYNI